MKCLEVSGAVRPIYGSLGVKRLRVNQNCNMSKKRFTKNPEFHELPCDGNRFIA